jgi:acetyl-CoA acetyltransferase
VVTDSAILAGAAATRFGKQVDTSLRTLASEAASGALADAGLQPSQVQAVYFANAAGGLITGQEMIRGQAALRDAGLLGAPLYNVENACASGSSALALAVAAVTAGQVEVALVVGAEKLATAERGLGAAALGSAVDLDEREALAAWTAAQLDLGEDSAQPRSLFMDLYGARAKLYADYSGAKAEDLAAVVVKSRHNASLNPKAQFRTETSIFEVLAARQIVPGLTLPMCSPIGDGAAAVVITAPGWQPGSRPTVRVAACEVVTGFADTEMTARMGNTVSRAAGRAYERAGIGPHDVSVVELHDAAAPAELMAYEELGLAEHGAGAELLRSGVTGLGGRIPVNTGGGLLSRGHPVGATGLAQIVELNDQLLGRAGNRQVSGCRIALAENTGGWIGGDAATTVVTILQAHDNRSGSTASPVSPR